MAVLLHRKGHICTGGWLLMHVWHAQPATDALRSGLGPGALDSALAARGTGEEPAAGAALCVPPGHPRTGHATAERAPGAGALAGGGFRDACHAARGAASAPNHTQRAHRPHGEALLPRYILWITSSLGHEACMGTGTRRHLTVAWGPRGCTVWRCVVAAEVEGACRDGRQGDPGVCAAHEAGSGGLGRARRRRGGSKNLCLS